MSGVVVVDAVRATALASVVGGLALHGWVAAAVFFLVLGGTVVPRAAGAPVALDAAYCVTILTAAWAAVLDWYLAVPWLDVVVHAAATGLVATLAHWLLVRLGAATAADDPHLRHPRAAVALVVAAAGTALAVVWELLEWFGHARLDDRIQVGYADTLGDLAAGMLGSALAGVVLGGGLLGKGADR